MAGAACLTKSSCERTAHDVPTRATIHLKLHARMTKLVMLDEAFRGDMPNPETPYGETEGTETTGRNRNSDSCSSLSSSPSLSFSVMQKQSLRL
jgi:hypothetical protein